MGRQAQKEKGLKETRQDQKIKFTVQFKALKIASVKSSGKKGNNREF